MVRSLKERNSKTSWGTSRFRTVSRFNSAFLGRVALRVRNRVAGEEGGRQGRGVKNAGGILGGLILLLLSGFDTAMAEERRFSFERPLMGTRFAIICHGTEELAAKAAADEFMGGL